MAPQYRRFGSKRLKRVGSIAQAPAPVAGGGSSARSPSGTKAASRLKGEKPGPNPVEPPAKPAPAPKPAPKPKPKPAKPLKALLRSEQCPRYARSGVCPRQHSSCPLRHDPTLRAVCPHWLTRHCREGARCRLQHQVVRDLMPVCIHFASGRCDAADCPFLHASHPEGAPVCRRFLDGYCPAGALCPHRHLWPSMLRQEERLRRDEAGEEGGRASAKKKRLLKGVNGAQCSVHFALRASKPESSRKKMRYLDLAGEQDNGASDQSAMHPALDGSSDAEDLVPDIALEDE
ncbi:hypothetical protein H632_c1344p0 [Helicosporidium sp. ATCC 50920]|nr:hypothetical protein H632_c1344p0 [Helicosporidium sp. ATCC 50920]|eukprot:KDD74395.1 hypothetical protein H632_c1344p0 [Helicosporidium sp. ATCC 50920]